jgi:hypothetical protein
MMISAHVHCLLASWRNFPEAWGSRKDDTSAQPQSHRRRHAVHSPALQTRRRLVADMSAMLLFGPAEAGYAARSSAPPPRLMLKLSQMKASCPYSATAQQPALRPLARVSAAPSRPASPEKLASTAPTSRARWSSRSGGPSSSARYTASGSRATSTRRRTCRAPSRRSGSRAARSPRAMRLTSWASTPSWNTRCVADVVYTEGN